MNMYHEAPQWRRSSYCANGACLETWTRSTFCSSGNCVECRDSGEAVLVRDSKLGDTSPILGFDTDAWRHFIGAVKADAFSA